MSARDLSSAPDDALLAAVGGMFDALDPVPDAVTAAAENSLPAPTPTEAGARFNSHRNRVLAIQAETGLDIHDATTLANGGTPCAAT